MSSNFKDSIVINRNAVEVAYDKNFGLKNNEEYEKWANEAAIKLIEYFEQKYKGVTIEIPELREKSNKSILGKIKNLQIERISKLCAVDTVTDKEKREFIDLIKERIEEEPSLDKDSLLKELDTLMFSNKIDISEFEEKFMVEGLSKSTKTALLRILVGKIEKAKYEGKIEDLNYLNEQYGEKAEEITGNPEKNIVKYESLRKLKSDERKFNRLKDANEYLKVNDLRGMKIVASIIPDDLQTDNKDIKKLIQKRKSAKTNKQKIEYSQKIIVEIGKEFFNDIENNQELLNNAKLDVIPGSSRHKKKNNGYEADHIKFMNSEEPEYTLELQFKSGYVEDKTMAKGSASHENRPGKERKFPKAKNDEELKNKIEYMCPSWTLFRKEDGKYTPKKLTKKESAVVYFQEQPDIFNEIERVYSKDENKDISKQ